MGKKGAGTPGIKTFKISELKAAKYNPRTIDEAALAGLTKSIERFGCVEPIVVNIRGGRNRIIGGHQRLKALQTLGVKSCICVTVDCSNGDEKLLNLALNNPLIQGQFVEQIGEYISALQKELPEDLAFLDMRIAELAGDIEPAKEGLTPDDQVPEPPKKPKTKPGDLYLLGEHRLLCGDSTKAEDVERLMDGQKADMAFADPPYGVDYGGHGNPRSSQKHASMANDNLHYSDLEEFWVRGFTTIGDWVIGDLYVAAASGPPNQYLARALAKTPFEHHQWLIWVKDQLVLGRSNYHYRHEHLWYGWKQNQKSSYCGGRDQDSVWEIARPKRSDDHPTMKPVELVMKAINNSSKNGACCLDPFLGSGTTLIACEKLNRRCFGMEIEPRYCDVTVERWEAWTGKKAERIRKK